MSTLLALDTATEACSVALLHDGKVLSHYEVIPRLHAQRLLPMIKDLLAEAGIAMSALDAIAFGRGPGGFYRRAHCHRGGSGAGVRTGASGAAGVQPRGPRAFREHGATQVAAAIDARMDEVYWGCYRETAGEMRLIGDEAVMAPERATLPTDANGHWFGSGTGWGYAERIPVASMLPHAQDLLTLATFAWNRGESLPADDAQPVYLRDKVATPKAR